MLKFHFIYYSDLDVHTLTNFTLWPLILSECFECILRKSHRGLSKMYHDVVISPTTQHFHQLANRWTPILYFFKYEGCLCNSVQPIWSSRASLILSKMKCRQKVALCSPVLRCFPAPLDRSPLSSQLHAQIDCIVLCQCRNPQQWATQVFSLLLPELVIS